MNAIQASSPVDQVRFNLDQPEFQLRIHFKVFSYSYLHETRYPTAFPYFAHSGEVKFFIKALQSYVWSQRIEVAKNLLSFVICKETEN